jgi:hypothetical protein
VIYRLAVRRGKGYYTRRKIKRRWQKPANAVKACATGRERGVTFLIFTKLKPIKGKNQKQKKMAWVARPTLHGAKRSALQKVQIRFKKTFIFTK